MSPRLNKPTTISQQKIHNSVFVLSVVSVRVCLSRVLHKINTQKSAWRAHFPHLPPPQSSETKYASSRLIDSLDGPLARAVKWLVWNAKKWKFSIREIDVFLPGPRASCSILFLNKPIKSHAPRVYSSRGDDIYDMVPASRGGNNNKNKTHMHKKQILT